MDIFLSIFFSTTVASGLVFLCIKTFLTTGIKESVAAVYKQQLEVHKFRLSNSEKVFQFKLDASQRLCRLYHNILPEQTHPDQEFDEVIPHIADCFDQHEAELVDFLCEYQATLSNDVLHKIRTAISACSDGKFGFYWTDDKTGGPTCTPEAGEMATVLVKTIREATESLRKEVHEMITVTK
jgi:hypothetical protein